MCMYRSHHCKKLGAEPLMSFPGGHFTCYNPLLEGIKHVLCDFSGRGSLDLVNSRFCPTHLFPSLSLLCILCCNRSSRELDYILSPVSPPSKSLNLGALWAGQVSHLSPAAERDLGASKVQRLTALSTSPMREQQETGRAQ